MRLEVGKERAKKNKRKWDKKPLSIYKQMIDQEKRKQGGLVHGVPCHMIFLRNEVRACRNSQKEDR